MSALSTNVDLAICTGRDAGVFVYKVDLSEKMLGLTTECEVVECCIRKNAGSITGVEW